MKPEFIQSFLEKRGIDARHWMSYYNKYTEDWFEPSNGKDDAFDVANSLHEFGLLQKKRIPAWQKGSMTGFRIYFKKLEG